jgi:LysM repeat protein
MNFSSDSVKLKSKPQNEDFYFDIDTPRGHFFAVLDFAPHDYANLNATLKGKLETIVGSFVSLSRFSADLFLGFLAKEINNFLHNLGEQSGGPELLCSAALCLVSGNRLSYFLSSDVSMNIVSSGRLLPLNGQRADASVLAGKRPAAEQAGNQLVQLGAHDQEAPLTDRVQAFTLQDDDVVLIMTRGLVEAFEGQQLTNEILSLRSPDPKIISDTLMKAGESSRDDRTLVVITGPYERYVDPVLADLSKTVASLEARVSSLTEGDQQRDSGGLDRLPGDPGSNSQLEQRFGQQLEIVKDDLRGKAAKIDLLELDEKLKNLHGVLAGKADTAQVLTLQRDVLKLGLVAKGVRLPGENKTGEATATRALSEGSVPQELATAGVAEQQDRGRRPYSLGVALLIFVIAIGAGFFGGWLQSRLAKRSPEVWSVKTAGNQISINRLDAGGGQGVTLSVAQPLNVTGEQTFSSFTDVKHYVDTLTSAQAGSEQTSPTSQSKVDPQTPVVTEVAIGRGDTLDRIARRNNITTDRLKELNPQITNWRVLKVGQKVMVPMAPAG